MGNQSSSLARTLGTILIAVSIPVGGYFAFKAYRDHPQQTPTQSVVESDHQSQPGKLDNAPAATTLPEGWQYYAAEHGAYELVNKNLPYRGDPTFAKFGCQGVGSDPDAPSIDRIEWMDSESWDYLQQSCHPVDAASVPSNWRTALERVMKQHTESATALPTQTPQPSQWSTQSTPTEQPHVDCAAALSKATEDHRVLVGRIRQLKTDNGQASLELHKEHQTIDSMKQDLETQKQTISRLDHNVDVTNQTIQSKDKEIADLIATVGRQKAQDTQVLIDKEVAGPVSEEPDILWPNVEVFRPASYKRDMIKRIYRAAEDRLAPGFGNVSVKFTIAKDGRPTNIQLIDATGDKESLKRSVAFIEAVGPFRPLLSPALDSLDVAADLSEQPESSTVAIEKLEISALGNRS